MPAHDSTSNRDAKFAIVATRFGRCLKLPNPNLVYFPMPHETTCNVCSSLIEFNLLQVLPSNRNTLLSPSISALGSNAWIARFIARSYFAFGGCEEPSVWASLCRLHMLKGRWFEWFALWFKVLCGKYSILQFWNERIATNNKDKSGWLTRQTNEILRHLH